MEEKKGLLDTLNSNRKKEEEMLATMSEQEVKEYMQKKTNAGIEIAKKLGLKVGK